jgi:hypothetical protein
VNDLEGWEEQAVVRGEVYLAAGKTAHWDNHLEILSLVLQAKRI